MGLEIAEIQKFSPDVHNVEVHKRNRVKVSKRARDDFECILLDGADWTRCAVNVWHKMTTIKMNNKNAHTCQASSSDFRIEQKQPTELAKMSASHLFLDWSGFERAAEKGWQPLRAFEKPLCRPETQSFNAKSANLKWGVQCERTTKQAIGPGKRMAMCHPWCR